METQNIVPQTIKSGRSQYVIERHFNDKRTITDAIYELLRVEATLSDSETSKVQNKSTDSVK